MTETNNCTKTTKKPSQRAKNVKKRNNVRVIKQQSDMFTLLAKECLHIDVVKELKFHPTRKWRFDYAIPSHRIALEVEGGVWTGGRHINPKGFLGDMEKYNEAGVRGWIVLRCTPENLAASATIEMLKNALKMRNNTPKCV